MSSAFSLNRTKKIWSNGHAYGLAVWEGDSPNKSWGAEPLLSLDTTDYHNCLLKKEDARALAEAILKWAAPKDETLDCGCGLGSRCSEKNAALKVHKP